MRKKMGLHAERLISSIDCQVKTASQSLHDGTRRPTAQKRAPVNRYHIHFAIYQPPFARLKPLVIRLWLSFERVSDHNGSTPGLLYPFVLFGIRTQHKALPIQEWYMAPGVGKVGRFGWEVFDTVVPATGCLSISYYVNR